MAHYYIYTTATSIIKGAYRNRQTPPAAASGETRVEVAYASPSMVGHEYSAEGIHRKVPHFTPKGVATRFLLPAFREWYAQLDRARHSYHPDIIKLGENQLYWGMAGNYLIASDKDIPAASRISHMLSMAQGAADTEDADGFFQKSATITAATGPISWVDQTDYATRLNMANVVTIAGTLPSGLVLLSDVWAGELPE